MAHVISIVPVTPMRSEPSHRSEQKSQLLFGEVALVLEIAKDFTKIQSLYEGYEGWCQTSQLANITDEQSSLKQHLLCSETTNQIRINEQLMHIPLGCSLSLFTNGTFECQNYKATYDGVVTNIEDGKYTEENITSLTKKYLNTSYLWGGRTIFGVDCSGFTQMIFRFMNIRLLRDAYQQATQGEGVGFLQEAKCGDLAFFDNEEGKITHVGILLNTSTIIHASGKVRIDSIDNAGIINSETGIRTHNLRLIKRMSS